MKQLRNNVIRAGLDALYYTGAHHVLRPLLAGVGTIFMLHHVRPARDDMFQPNRHLEITPGFLREVLTHVRSLGVDIVSLDEAHRRMSERDFARRFACFTFDDGYRDNRDHALPVMREFRAPLTPAGHFKFLRVWSVKFLHPARQDMMIVSLTLFPGQGLQRPL